MGNTTAKIDTNKASYWSQPNPYAARLQHDASTVMQQFNTNTNNTGSRTITTQRYSGSGASGYSDANNQFTTSGTGMRLGSYSTQSSQPAPPSAPAPPLISNGQIRSNSSTPRTAEHTARMSFLDNKLKQSSKFRTDHKKRMRQRWEKYAEINSVAANNNSSTTAIYNTTGRNTVARDIRDNTVVNTTNHNNNVINNYNNENNNNVEISRITTASYNPFLDDSLNTELDIALSKSQFWSIPTIELIIRILNNLHNSINTHTERRNSRSVTSPTSTLSANSSETYDKRRIRLNSTKIQTDIVTVDGALDLLYTIGFQQIQMPSNTNFGTVEPYLFFDVNTVTNINEVIENITYSVDILSDVLNDKNNNQTQYEQTFDPF